MIKIANNYDLDSNMFLRPEEIRQVIDLSGEKNRFVRQVVRESGENFPESLRRCGSISH